MNFTLNHTCTHTHTHSQLTKFLQYDKRFYHETAYFRFNYSCSRQRKVQIYFICCNWLSEMLIYISLSQSFSICIWLLMTNHKQQTSYKISSLVFVAREWKNSVWWALDRKLCRSISNYQICFTFFLGLCLNYIHQLCIL